MAYLTASIINTVNAIATLNDSDNISLLDTLNGLNDLRGYVEFAPIPHMALGYGNFPVEYDDSLISCEEAQAILYVDWLSSENEAQESLTTWRDTRINGLSPIDDMLREQSNVLNRLADIRLGAYRTLVNLEHHYYLIADNVLLLAAR